MEHQPYLHSIEFELSRILKCITHISETSNVATALFHLTKDATVSKLYPMRTDGLGFVFPNENGETAVNPGTMMDWVLRKAFEDFIVGLSQSLTEANIFLKYCSLGKTTKDNPIKGGPDGVRKLFAKISKDAMRMSIPQLIANAEKEIGTQLLLKDEVLSINQVRNCLVHRAGVVSDSDMQPTSLSLKYVDLVMYVQHSDGTVDILTADMKERNLHVDRFALENVGKTIEFKLGEKIAIGADVFKAVTYTTIAFIQQLVLRMPIPEDKKALLIQPLMIQFGAAPNKS